MAHSRVHRLACVISLLALTSATKEQTRWSRQLSTYTSDMGDWVPLRSPLEREEEIPQPQIKRQAVAEPRILTEPFPGLTRPSGFSADMFPSRNFFNNQANRQLYLQSVPSVPSAPQNYLTDQGFGQGLRFGLSQPNFPANQGFAAPPLGFENGQAPPQSKPVVRPQTFQSIPMNQMTFPQAPSLSVGKPFLNQPQKVKSDTPKFVDGYRAENASNEFVFSPKKKPQSLQKIKFESGEKVKQEIIPQRTRNEKGEEIQLLYVPLEQLNRGQFNFRSPLTNSQLVNTELYSQNLPRPNPGNQNYLNDYRPSAKPLDMFSGQNYFADFNSQLKDLEQVSKYTTLTTPFATHAPITPKSKKLKPHQPPLAIFMKDASKNSPLKVGDVLSSLKTAETIAVLDSVNPLNAPKVFIGPSNMPPPENFVKFDLPYLSNIDHSDSKLKQLPFFVAPLSYNTPNGFAKIPFPSPHVGSVVINAQIKESPQTQATLQPNINQNYYTATYNPETQKPVTQKPTFTYFSTGAPRTKPVPNYQSNFYSFEPQTVTSLRTPLQPETQTAPPKTGSYFLNNAAPQYNSQDFTNFSPQDNYKSSEIINQFHRPRQPEYTTTLRTTTTSTTTKSPSTYPSQLLETHNPYSINQAFHFSTPLDYHNYFDDIKQPYITPGSIEVSSPSPTQSSPSPSSTTRKPEQRVTVKPKYQQQSSPSYLNNYSPEIHYNIDNSPKYPVFTPNEYIGKAETTSQQPPSYVDNSKVNKYITNTDTSNNKYNANVDTLLNQHPDVTPAVNNYNIDTYNKYNSNFDTSVNTYKVSSESPVNQYNSNTDSVENNKPEYNQNVDTSASEDNPPEISNTPAVSEDDTPLKYDEQNNYDVNPDIAEVNPTSSTSTSSTTTRRNPVRIRGRPRYTTTPRFDSYESSTKVVTRRPLRERRPLPTRPRYEPNKISTENSNKKPLDSSESTTKISRTRTRGRVQYRPSDSEENYDRKKSHNTKEQDLAYQRDVLHQNYPVTLMERASTVDIEAITEPTLRQSSANVQEPATETLDTENAYTHERAQVSEQEEVKDVSPFSTFTVRNTVQTETPYVPKLPSTRNEEYYYQSRSSVAPFESSASDEAANDKEEDIYVKQTTPVPKQENTEPDAYATETTATEENVPSYSSYTEQATVKQEEENTAPETDDTKIASSENAESEEDENIIQTTPSYNRVRVRPGVIRQYHQASSTESSKIKERRRPSQSVTYRPAFDRRRTTMRIDEIEADLKTKQVHTRTEQEYKHPVYKPEASVTPASVAISSTETSTKRNHLRRRRPSYSYSTTSTEASSTKRSYEAKNRFRGRRPTEKSSEKPDITTEAPSSTTKAPLHSRYSHRPRLSERYHKKPEPEVEAEDQELNYSINRPKFAEVESEQWSPKITGDSFKPYNPNDIVDEQRIVTTEGRTDKASDLDIITARSEYEDILLTVTPATNNRMIKKIPDIPPTLEAFVEQSKVTNSDATDTMSTFESMLEEVMKGLDEQDKDEYTNNVMKHKGGEIGEIPPERIISSGDSYVPKSTMPLEEMTTELTPTDASPLIDEDENDHKAHRRGFWKRVKVRPLPTESIEFAESQYYSNTVNRLGQPVKNQKAVHEKAGYNEKTKVTTYKPKFQFLSDFFSSADDLTDVDDLPPLEINKIKANKTKNEEMINDVSKQTTVPDEKETPTISPGDFDLGTGSPDPTIDDLYLTTSTEPTPTKADDRSDTFSFMNYLFGMTSEASDAHTTGGEKNATKVTESEIQITTELPKTKIVTTESAFIPEEITTSVVSNDSTDVPEVTGIKKINSSEDTDKVTEDTTVLSVRNVESSSVSSFMDPENVMSTSMSTEVSHETEICFRGKCIKTSKDIL